MIRIWPKLYFFFSAPKFLTYRHFMTIKLLKSKRSKISHLGTFRECCQVFSKFPAQKFVPFVKITLWLNFIKVWLNFWNHTSTKICKNSRFDMFHVGKIQETKHFRCSALYQPCQAKLCLISAADMYTIQPLQSSAAEESTSKEH